MMLKILFILSLLQGGNLFASRSQVEIALSKRGPHCKGILLEEMRVVTARHCVFGYSAKNLNINVNNRQIRVSSVEGVGETFSFPAHDVALLHLAEPIKLSSYPKVGAPMGSHETIVSMRTPHIMEWQNTRKHTCVGDSGSGLFTSASEPTLFGIVVGRLPGLNDDMNDCSLGGFLSLNLYPYVEWLYGGKKMEIPNHSTMASSLKEACQRPFDDSPEWGTVQNILTQLVEGLNLSRKQARELYSSCRQVEKYLESAGNNSMKLTLYGEEIGDAQFSWLRDYPAIEIIGWRQGNARLLSGLSRLNFLSIVGIADPFDCQKLTRHKSLRRISLKHGAVKNCRNLNLSDMKNGGVTINTFDLLHNAGDVLNHGKK